MELKNEHWLAISIFAVLFWLSSIQSVYSYQYVCQSCAPVIFTCPSTLVGWNCYGADFSSYCFYGGYCILPYCEYPNYDTNKPGGCCDATCTSSGWSKSANNAKCIISSQVCKVSDCTCVTPICSSDPGCDDQNPCTNDVCNNPGTASASCSHTNKAAGTSCSDCKNCDGNGNCNVNKADGTTCGTKDCTGNDDYCSGSNLCTYSSCTKTCSGGTCNDCTFTFVKRDMRNTLA